MKTAIYTCVLLAAAGATWFQWRHQQPELRKWKPVPEFDLIERSGEPVRLADLKGTVWLADFVYTTCPGPCPLLTSHFSDLQEKALAHPDVRLVSISLTPEHDTPAVLRDYAAHFKASDRWLFLTGPKQQIHDLVQKGFLQSVVEQPDEKNPVVHGTKLVLVDRKGIIRAFYDGGDRTLDGKILRDIARLVRE